ncbi:MAG: SocA family protein [Magnetococcales bacterium]|nr:SocA family protein [Magnetococcales bacterium]
MSTATVFDVAAYILEKVGSVTAMKLQKLVYYSQAWSLVWDDSPLFDEPIQAWANGPVVPALFAAHQGQFKVSRESLPVGNPDNLTASEQETVDAVIKYYGEKSSQYLSDLTHMEDPWRKARAGMLDGERGNQVITHAALDEYYGSLPPGTEMTA